MILTANSRQLSEGPVPGAHSLTHYSVTTKTRQRSACHLLPQTVSGHKFKVYNNIKQSTERRNKYFTNMEIMMNLWFPLF